MQIMTKNSAPQGTELAFNWPMIEKIRCHIYVRQHLFTHVPHKALAVLMVRIPESGFILIQQRKNHKWNSDIHMAKALWKAPSHFHSTQETLTGTLSYNKRICQGLQKQHRKKKIKLLRKKLSKGTTSRRVSKVILTHQTPIIRGCSVIMRHNFL